MQRVTGGKALSETGRGRIRAAVGLPKWVSIRRRQTGGGGLAAGAMGYLPQGDCGKIRPNPLTSAVPLTWARGFGHRINQKRVAADAKGDRWQGALTETGRGRIRAAVDLPKWVLIRRRQTGGGGLAAGAMGYL